MKALSIHKARVARMALSASRAEPPLVLTLGASGDLWLLVGPHDEVVFASRSRAGRQECLEFAHDHAVLALTS